MRPEPYAWSVHLEATLPVLALAIGYVVALRRFRAGAWRIACFGAGVAMLLSTAVTPLDALSYHLLSAHLLQNVVLAEWAPALLVLGVPPGLAREVANMPGWAALTRPAVALPLWLTTYFVWHVPALYDAALREPALLHLEHLAYLVAGTLFWWSVLQETPHAPSSGHRAAYLFAGFVLASPLGLLLALVPEAVYAFYVDGPRLWGLSALTDQQIAGVTMAGEQAVVFFAAFVFFFLRFLSEEDTRA